MFGDATHGNFDKRTYAKAYVREYGKKFKSSVLADTGATATGANKQNFLISNEDDLKIQTLLGAVQAQGISTSGSTGPTAADVALEVWNYINRTLTSGAPTAAENAAAVLAAAQAAPIHADTRKMNGAAVIGTGISTDLWRGE